MMGTTRAQGSSETTSEQTASSLLHSGVTADMSLLEQNAIFITNIGLLTAFVANTLLLIFTPSLSGGYHLLSVLGYWVAGTLYVVAFWLVRRAHPYAGRLLLSGVVLAIPAVQVLAHGVSSGFQFLYVPIAIGSLMIWPNARIHQSVIASSAVVFFLVLSVLAPSGDSTVQLSDRVTQGESLFVFSTALALITAVIVVFSLMIATERFQVVIDELRRKADQKAVEREQQMLASLYALARSRDDQPDNHTVRVQHYVKCLADQLVKQMDGLALKVPDWSEKLFNAAALHDIGKIAIADEILQKPYALNGQEIATLNTHTSIGESILLAAQKDDSQGMDQSDVLTLAIQMAGGHHERWDGAGYPRGLAAEMIPLAARIMAVADAYDVMMRKQAVWTLEAHQEAVDLLRQGAGHALDPAVVKAFLVESENFRKIAQTFCDYR
jgi:HD-GYP domain-containing protein (c-di-GMP phosphodiesterase class II)